jgi:hypothetical protein
VNGPFEGDAGAFIVLITAGRFCSLYIDTGLELRDTSCIVIVICYWSLDEELFEF